MGGKKESGALSNFSCRGEVGGSLYVKSSSTSASEVPCVSCCGSSIMGTRAESVMNTTMLSLVLVLDPSTWMMLLVLQVLVSYWKCSSTPILARNCDHHANAGVDSEVMFYFASC